MAAKRKAYAKMSCDLCKNINHFYHKSKQMVDKLATSMFCNHCKKHTAHKENKK